MVCYHVIAAQYIISVFTYVHTFTLLLMIQNAPGLGVMLLLKIFLYPGKILVTFVVANIDFLQ